MSRQLDFILVGQGLAGSVLACILAEKGYRLTVFSDGEGPSASGVSAGIINPITGRRLVLRQGFKRLLRRARECYVRLESKLGIPVFRHIDQHRLFVTQEQAARFTARLEDGDYSDAVTQGVIPGPPANGLCAPHGHAKIAGTACVDTPMLLGGARKYLADNGCLVPELFCHDELLPSAGHVVYREWRARYIVFCEGAAAVNNPWFPGLPFQLSGGDILTIRLPNRLDGLIHWGHWLFPLSNDTYRLGATNDWNVDQSAPSESAKKILLESLSMIYSEVGNIEIIDHMRGVRPATSDRGPLVLQHSSHPELIMFNGFGSKGSLTIPTAAIWLVEQLQSACPLPRYDSSH